GAGEAPATARALRRALARGKRAPLGARRARGPAACRSLGIEGGIHEINVIPQLLDGLRPGGGAWPPGHAFMPDTRRRHPTATIARRGLKRVPYNRVGEPRRWIS